MNIEIDGQTFPLLPRVTEMLRLLMKHQGSIEQKEYGQVVLDYNESRVKIKLPPTEDTQKIPRTHLTNGKTPL